MDDLIDDFDVDSDDFDDDKQSNDEIDGNTNGQRFFRSEVRVDDDNDDVAVISTLYDGQYRSIDYQHDIHLYPLLPRPTPFSSWKRRLKRRIYCRPAWIGKAATTLKHSRRSPSS